VREWGETEHTSPSPRQDARPLPRPRTHHVNGSSWVANVSATHCAACLARAGDSGTNTRLALVLLSSRSSVAWEGAADPVAAEVVVVAKARRVRARSRLAAMCGSSSRRGAEEGLLKIVPPRQFTLRAPPKHSHPRARAAPPYGAELHLHAGAEARRHRPVPAAAARGQPPPAALLLLLLERCRHGGPGRGRRGGPRQPHAEPERGLPGARTARPRNRRERGQQARVLQEVRRSIVLSHRAPVGECRPHLNRPPHSHSLPPPPLPPAERPRRSRATHWRSAARWSGT
jgi:hypothetical protein